MELNGIKSINYLLIFKRKDFNMKKYFIAETDEELEFGDKIQIVLTKRTKHGLHNIESEFEFSEDTIPFLLEAGVIEEQEVEDDEENDDLVDFDDEETCEALDELIEDFESLEERVDALETLTKDTYNTITEVLSILKEEIKKEEIKKSPESPKKKKK